MTNGTPDCIPPPETSGEDESSLLRALRERDEEVFASLLDRWYGSMLRIAVGHVGSRARAEEVVQETWLAVLGGLDRFEGRSSLRTWVFRILVNRARTIGAREARLVPVSTLFGPGDEDDGAPTHWLPDAEPWSVEQSADDWLLSRELRTRIELAIGGLPYRQREVITLRDIEGWSSEEVRTALDISEANQRVLLHRARVRVREALAGYLSE